MPHSHKKSSIIGSLLFAAIAAVLIYVSQGIKPDIATKLSSVKAPVSAGSSQAASILGTLAIKGRAPKTNYTREQFGGDWTSTQGCDTRDAILKRDLTNITVDTDCHVLTGTLQDPYTTKTIAFTRGVETSSSIQIDHVVALSNAWQTGAQLLTQAERVTLANDPLELLAVDGPTNQQKSDGDAATWLPPNKAYRCSYVARQVAVKQKYSLWITQAEHDAIASVLATCPQQTIPSS